MVAIERAPVIEVKRGEIIEFELNVSPSRDVVLERDAAGTNATELGTAKRLSWQATGSEGRHRLAVRSSREEVDFYFDLQFD